MSEDRIPYLPKENFEYEDQQLWDNTLRDGLEEFEVSETIQKIRNYYNGDHNIDGRRPRKKE